MAPGIYYGRFLNTVITFPGSVVCYVPHSQTYNLPKPSPWTATTKGMPIASRPRSWRDSLARRCCVGLKVGAFYTHLTFVLLSSNSFGRLSPYNQYRYYPASPFLLQILFS